MAVGNASNGADSLLPGENIAIVGMAGVFPGAPNVRAYWENIVAKVDVITDPPEGWGSEYVYDPTATENDRIYTRRGGFLGDLARFNPMEFGIMPCSVDGGEPDHYLALQLTGEALQDAGYAEAEKRPPRERIEIIVGRGTYINRGWTTLAQHGLVVDQTLDILKQLHPEWSGDELQAIRRELKGSLPPFNAETAAGMVPNILTGRIANRFDFMGPNFIVDAACASSLVALELGVRDLLIRTCDMALVGGIQASTPPPLFMIFSQFGALSRRGQIRAFDKDADGTLLGEGGGIVVLKRLADAKRAGDRIYAVIKGIGTASDGRGMAVLTPRLEGEVLVLRRAYQAAGLSPSTVELIEAHGTGTPVGDMTEIQALRQVFGPRQGPYPSVAVGSVKSMISHLIPAAGIAGLIKTALALYHGVLPPTLHCDEPNPKFELEKTPFYINTETRPWIHGALDCPRRAGVNAFGFGGINAHVILEEHVDDTAEQRVSLMQRWDSEVFVLEGDSRPDLIERGHRLKQYLGDTPSVALKDLAYTLNTDLGDKPYHLAIVASSLEDLLAKLEHALERLSDPQRTQIKDRGGIYFSEEPLARQGKLAFLFPGEGSQYVNMLSDLCIHFPEVRAWFDLVDRAFIRGGRKEHLPTQFIFLPSNGGIGTSRTMGEGLWQMEGAVAAVSTANQALLTVLSRLEIRPDALLGHSTGEFTALQAAGIMDVRDKSLYEQCVIDLDTLYRRAATEAGVPRAALVAVGTDSATVVQILDRIGGHIHIAMDNCPHQTVVVGEEAVVERFVDRAQQKGLIYEVLPFDRPYHTPMFGAYVEHLRPFFARWLRSSPRVQTYSCATTESFPADLARIQDLALQHWMRPVEFRKTIEAMYTDGVRIFVEVGPKGNLTTFVDDILRTKLHLALASNIPSRSGITQLHHTVALLAAHGVPMRLGYLYERRAPQRLSLDAAADRAARRGRAGAAMKLVLGLPILRLKQDGQTDGPSARDAGLAVSTSVDLSTSLPVPPSTARSDDQGAGAERAVGNVPPSPPPMLPSSGEYHEVGPALATETKDVHPSPRVAQTPTALRPPDSRSLVMHTYFQTMQRFLEIQEQVMQAFLGNRVAVAPLASAPVSASTIASPSTEVLQGLEPSQDGVGCSAAPFILTQQPSTERPVPDGGREPLEPVAAITSSEAIADILLRLVSEKTGYPKEMLDLTLNLEADLGIDSIKRVEILGALKQQTDAFQAQDLEQVAGLKTLQEMIAFLEARSEQPKSQGHDERIPQSPAPDIACPGLEQARQQETPKQFPFVGTVTSLIPGQELVALRELNLEEDIFLLDHTLGREISVGDEGLRGLPVMPLTMSMEIMVEAAALLLPGRLAIGMKDIRAYDWIVLEEEPVALQIVARCNASSQAEEVEVQIRKNEDAATSRGIARGPIIEGKVIFGDAYPEPPPVGDSSLRGEQPCPWATPGRFYPHSMFHGPSFQSVVSIDRWGEDGLEASMRVLPTTGLFRSVPSPSFITDPVLLDALGQVVGFWIAEFPTASFVAFPFELEALYLYGPNLPPGERATCQGRIALVGNEQTRSDIDLIGQDGRFRMRLVGWKDTGFNMPKTFFRFILEPKDVVMSSTWPTPLAGFHTSGTYQCCHLDGFPKDFFEAHGKIWQRVLAYLVLGRRERETWRSLGGPGKRRIEWLLGRTAAKDAVRVFIKNRYGMELCPADIEIVTDEHGRPVAQGRWTKGLPCVPILSIAHSDGVAVAISGDCGDGARVGIDIERMGRISQEAMGDLAFTPQERELLASVGADAKDEWSLRLWCGKEAVAKALGRGIIGGPQALVAQEVDARTGRMRIALAGEMAKLLPEFADVPITVYTAREGDLIVATSLCERT